MHDPNTVAFEIKNPFVKADKHGYKPSIITIWHRDPEKGGSDDSCGRFIRAHHMDKGMVEKVRKDLEFEYQYWFDELTGWPKFSVIAIAVGMFQRAAWTIMIYENGGRIPKGDPLKKFMRKHLYEIIQFAENHIDSLYNAIVNKYSQSKEERVEHFTNIVAPFVMRLKRSWWQHPRWHIHHWRFQFHPFQNLRRRYWLKCSVCGKRGFKTSPMSDWDGTRRWHQECDLSRKQPTSNSY